MPRHQDSTFFVAFLTSIVVAIGTSVVVHLVVLPRFPLKTAPSRPQESVMVPPLAGLPLAKAREMLTTLGLQMGVNGYQHHPNAAAGTILTHAPAVGSAISKQAEVKVVISLGPKIAIPTESPSASDPSATTANQATATPPPKQPSGSQQIAVPSLRGMGLSRAKEKLKQAGLNVGRLVYSYDEDISPNWVLGQKPAAGTQLAPGSKVDIIINRE